MSMSTHVYGIRPMDDEYRAKMAAWYACEEAGVEIPDEVVAFFNGKTPDEVGVVVDLRGFSPTATAYNTDMGSGFEVRVSDLVEQGFGIVRFVNRW